MHFLPAFAPVAVLLPAVSSEGRDGPGALGANAGGREAERGDAAAGSAISQSLDAAVDGDGVHGCPVVRGAGLLVLAARDGRGDVRAISASSAGSPDGVQRRGATEPGGADHAEHHAGGNGPRHARRRAGEDGDAQITRRDV